MLSPLFKICLWSLPFAHVLTFMVPYLFFFIRFTASSAFYFSELDSTSGSISAMKLFPGIDPSSNYFNYFTIDATTISPNILKPLDDWIYVNITFTTTFMYVWLSFSTSFLLLSMKNYSWSFLTSYYFLSKLGCIFSTPMPEISRLGLSDIPTS